MKYDLVIFDLDGTILNTLEDLHDSLNYALGRMGFPKRSLEEVRDFVGNGIRKLIERALPPGCDDKTIEEMLVIHREYYRVHCADKTRPYDGILELLAKLKQRGIRLAVLSNKPDYAVKILCDRYFPGIFDKTYGFREGIERKPAPDAVFALLEELGVQRERAVYVGDSEVDVQTAKNAGLDMVIVEWGFRKREFLIANGAVNLVSAPGEILERAFV